MWDGGATLCKQQHYLLHSRLAAHPILCEVAGITIPQGTKGKLEAAGREEWPCATCSFHYRATAPCCAMCGAAPLSGVRAAAIEETRSLQRGNKQLLDQPIATAVASTTTNAPRLAAYTGALLEAIIASRTTARTVRARRSAWLSARARWKWCRRPGTPRAWRCGSNCNLKTVQLGHLDNTWKR